MRVDCVSVCSVPFCAEHRGLTQGLPFRLCEAHAQKGQDPRCEREGTPAHRPPDAACVDSLRAGWDGRGPRSRRRELASATSSPSAAPSPATATATTAAATAAATTTTTAPAPPSVRPAEAAPDARLSATPAHTPRAVSADAGRGAQWRAPAPAPAPSAPASAPAPDDAPGVGAAQRTGRAGAAAAVDGGPGLGLGGGRARAV